MKCVQVISQAKNGRRNKKSSKVRWPWLRPGRIRSHNIWSFSKNDLHLKCSSLIFQFPINPIHLAHVGRSLPDVLATFEAFDTVGKDDSMFIIWDPRMSSKPPNSFFNESAAIVEVLLMIQESVNHHYGEYMIIYAYNVYIYIYTHVRICHDLLPEFVGRVFQGAGPVQTTLSLAYHPIDAFPPCQLRIVYCIEGEDGQDQQMGKDSTPKFSSFTYGSVGRLYIYLHENHEHQLNKCR